ncbi:fatty-acyl-CoA synthase [Xylariales sp. PMI_506]|nr:fatty-acyl-CoA synthase [Xylariales sp. PMI_506]
MSLAVAGGVAGATALAAYLDGRFHLRNDLRLGSSRLRLAVLLLNIYWKLRKDKLLIFNVFEDRAGTKQGDNVFLVFEDRQWTYNEFYRALLPVGNWLIKDLGIKKGEMVALDGINSPEWIMLWLGLEAIGAVPAFINHNLTSQSLLHCIKLGKVRYVLADQDVRDLVAPIEGDLADAGIKPIYYSPELLGSLTDTTPLPRERQRDQDPMEPACLIYTSGTTGMPKGTIMTRAREYSLTTGLTGGMLHFKPGDRIYTCLPLFHGAAHGLCMIPVIGAGATVILSRKFSHRTFWPEVHRHEATHIQYVGELCRYLVNAPPSDLDRGHKVTMAWGNGMRPDVWEQFRERFGITCINELYAASDGMGFSTNPNRGDFSRSAIGLRGPLWHLLNGANEKRVLIDPDTQEILRGDDGFVIPAGVNEPGETIYRMDSSDPDRGTPTYYGNHAAAVKRRIADAFTKGDLWFRSGDLMRLDADGRLYFVDRLGDTFRWKSENVSTNEVGDVVGAFPQVAEANVYGVLAPRSDGRCGCAAIVPVEGLDLSQFDFRGLAEHCLAALPRYAVPVFLRLARQLEYTGTMKMQKGRLRAEGVQLDVIEKAARDKGEEPDVLYWLPPGAREYVPFGHRELQELKSGGVRL